MTSEPPKKIPKALRQILAILVKNNFLPMKAKTIADKLGEEVNTINQRIIRDEETYFETTKPKPKTIRIKPGLKEAVFLRDNNRCYFCKRNFNSSDLSTRHLRTDGPDLDAWNNIIPICKSCNQKPDTDLVPRSQSVKGIPFKVGKSKASAWEYTIVRIRGVTRRQGTFSLGDKESIKKYLAIPEEYFYEFVEITNDLEGVDEEDWQYLEDNEGQPSASLTRIFNYFGNKGWELVNVRELDAPDMSGGVFDEFKENQMECFFKRRGGE